jgi:predicted nucleotidyltransferase
MSAKTKLDDNLDFKSRKIFSSDKIACLRERLNSGISEKVRDDVTVFAAGSYGRLEAGENSDLDLFVVGSKTAKISRLDETRLLAKIADVNDQMGLPSFSGEMRFFKLYSAKDLIENTGHPTDDTENSFTARMLLLESKCVIGDKIYDEIIENVISNYFRDGKGKSDFRPLFLLNDLLRYWRTLCLNYEHTRSDTGKPWRKKNLNLRFSRLSTVFSTVYALLAMKCDNVAMSALVQQTPFERLANAIDMNACGDMCEDFDCILNRYSWFLKLKDEKGSEPLLEDETTKADAKKYANEISMIFKKLLDSPSVSENSRFLTL